MDELLYKFNDTKCRIFEEFGCPPDYSVKYAENAMWRTTQDGAMTFLSYGESNERLANCVVVNREGKPMIYTKDGYTLIVVIECVKTAIIFRNEKKM